MPEQEDPLQTTLRRYLEALALTYRPKTVKHHRYTVSAFVSYNRTNHPSVADFSDLKREHMEGWFRSLAERLPPLLTSTRRGYLITVRVFLRYLWALGWSEAPVEDLFRRDDFPPQDRGLPKPLSWDADRRLQRELRANGGLIATGLLLLRATGMRLGELRDLTVDAVREQGEGQWALHVPLGKLHSERVIPLDAEALKLISHILQLRMAPQGTGHSEQRPSSEFLLTWPNGRRPAPRTFQAALSAAAKRAGLKERVWPHRLRHTLATEMLRGGMSLPTLMRLLGHKTISMTLRYASVTQADVRRAYFASLEAVKQRYQIPQGLTTADQQEPVSELIATQLAAAAAHMESLRRDETDERRQKKLQRLTRRLRKILTEFGRLSRKGGNMGTD